MTGGVLTLTCALWYVFLAETSDGSLVAMLVAVSLASVVAGASLPKRWLWRLAAAPWVLVLVVGLAVQTGLSASPFPRHVDAQAPVGLLILTVGQLTMLSLGRGVARLCRAPRT